MRDWLNSPDFFLLVVTLAAAALYGWNKRRLKKTCTTSTRKTGKAPEAAWITALRASIAGDAWKPGLKPSDAEKVALLQSDPSHGDVPRHLESTARQAADAENVAQAQPYHFYPHAPQLAESTAGRVADPEIVWVRCESGHAGIVKLRRWLMEGKTLFTVIVFPAADHEWEKVHEGQAVLEEVTEQQAKFRINGAHPWMFFPNCTVGYDRKRKRPLIQLRGRF